MRRKMILLGAVATTAVLTLASPAGAHATFGGATAVAGQTQPLNLEVPHELGDGPYNVDLLIAVPAGWTAVGCTTKATWSCTLETRDGQPVIHFVKAPGSAPAEDENFTFTVTAPASIGSYAFPTIQTYSNGTKAEWIGGSNPPASITTKAAPPTTPPPTTAPTTAPPAGPAPTTAAPTGAGGVAPTTAPGAAPTVAPGAPAAGGAESTLPGETPTTAPGDAGETAAGSTLAPTVGATPGSTPATAPTGGGSTETAAGPTGGATGGGTAPLLALGALVVFGAVAAVVVVRSRRMMGAPPGDG